jgi:trehalose synthase
VLSDGDRARGEIATPASAPPPAPAAAQDTRAGVHDVPISALSLGRFEGVLPAAEWGRVQQDVTRAGSLLAGRVVWNVNSTANGGGVAEMLRSLIGYGRGVGVDARWVTIAGDAGFFEVTKRLHNRLHGSSGDGGPLGREEHEAYAAPLVRCAGALQEMVHADDIVILHDPQTAGLIAPLRETGARIAWRSHVGYDTPNEIALEAWHFLLPYVRQADACIFSRANYAWGGIDAERLTFIHPSIDAFSVKNEDLDEESVLSILAAMGLLDGGGGPVSFLRADGTPGRVQRRAEILEEGRLTPATPVVLQVSRWDRLKDPLGVIDGFAGRAMDDLGAHLVLAGPAVGAVADDPEGPEVLAEARERWSRLDPRMRERVHLVSLPMEDAEENAAMVNALQRHATVVVQKSIAEGFGLTVAEAMWKARPLVASRVGGIQDQIVHGVSGLLVDDPRDLRAFADELTMLLGGPEVAARIGAEAHSRARDEFLGPAHLMQYLALFERLLAGERSGAAG